MAIISRKVQTRSISVLENGETLTVQLSFVLLPFVCIELFQSFVSQYFQFFVCLLQLLVDGSIVGSVPFANSVLLISFMP